jgi:hypothetical protein
MHPNFPSPSCASDFTLGVEKLQGKTLLPQGEKSVATCSNMANLNPNVE